MGYTPRVPVAADRLLDPRTAEHLAATLQALGAPSRLLILAQLRQGACQAGELAAAVGMKQSACSHQLRVLRTLGLVSRRREGRSVVYALHDHHVAALLDQAFAHIAHLRLS
jgi:DNA-binding transcriptional ArsR family regulator